MTPPRVRSRSSQWLSTGLSNMRQYSSARRMISALTTGASSSVKATAPPSHEPADLGQLRALPALGDGADGKDVGVAGPLGLQVDELRRRLVVEGRLRVRHARHRRDAARQCRGGAGGDRLVFFAARFAQVNVHVDEPGADDLAASRRWCALACSSGCGPMPPNLPAAHPQIDDPIDVLRGVDDPAVDDAKDVHAGILWSCRGAGEPSSQYVRPATDSLSVREPGHDGHADDGQVAVNGGRVAGVEIGLVDEGGADEDVRTSSKSRADSKPVSMSSHGTQIELSWNALLTVVVAVGTPPIVPATVDTWLRRW